MRKLALVLLGVLAASPAYAQIHGITLARDYDLDSTTTVYCTSIGKKGALTGGVTRGFDYQPPANAKVKTSGSSTTITSNTAASSALKYVGVGDLIVFIVNGQRQERLVVTHADDDTITVNTAIDLTGGYSYYFRDQFCNTSGEGADIPVWGLKYFQITLQVSQMDVDSGGIDLYIECKPIKDADYLVVDTVNIPEGSEGFSTTSFLTRQFRDEQWESCRAGIKLTDDDGTDTTTHAEKVNIYFSAEDAMNGGS